MQKVVEVTTSPITNLQLCHVDSLSLLSIFDAHDDNAMHGEGSFATTFGIGPWESENAIAIIEVFLKVQWHPCPSIYDQVCSLESYTLGSKLS